MLAVNCHMNVYYVAGIPYSDELYHHGIKGQKWGVHRNLKQLGYTIGQKMQQTVKKKLPDQNTKKRIKRAVKIGASAVAAGLLIYGAVKLEAGNIGAINLSRAKDRLSIDKGYKSLEDDLFKANKSVGKTVKELVGIRRAHDRAIGDLDKDIFSTAMKTDLPQKFRNAREYYRYRKYN